MSSIFINADDFGLKSSVNKAIIEAFNNEVITGTTLMANMPGFDEAVLLAHENNIISKIGIHLTLTEGYPLTEEILNTNLFNNENKADLKKHKRNLFFLKSNEKKLIYSEFAAQIEKVKKSGIQITHIDTHHHIDEVWSITQIILSLLKTYKIPAMRIMNNLSISSKLHKIAYRKLVNNIIKIKGANNSDFLGNQVEAILHLKKCRSLIEIKKLEIMVHPDYNDSGILIDKIKNREYSFDYPIELKRLISSQNIW